MIQMKRSDLTGGKFGDLEVLSYYGKSNSGLSL